MHRKPFGCLFVSVVLWSLVSHAQELESPAPFGDELGKELQKAGKQLIWMGSSATGSVTRSSKPEPGRIASFTHVRCPRLAHIDKRPVFLPLDEVPVPPVAFGLWFDASNEGLQHLPRFRATLHALHIADGRFCNIDIEPESLKVLAELKELRALSVLDGVSDKNLNILSGLTELNSLRIKGWITDEGLQHLAKLKNLQKLDLSSTKVTGAGLQHVLKNQKLTALQLSYTPITNEGIACLRGYDHLVTLNLRNSKIGDQAIAHVATLPNLQSLNLSDTEVTNAAVAELVRLENLATLELYNTRITQEALQPLSKKGVKIVRWSARQVTRIVPLRSPLEDERLIIVDGRPLEEWFADLKTKTKTPGDQEKVRRAEAVLKACAASEPLVSRMALWYDRFDYTHWRIRNAAGKLALPAIYDHLRDGIADWSDKWCIEKLREYEDESPEAIAALISALYSHNKVYGNNDDDLPRKAAVRLSEIGMPALPHLLEDHLAEGYPSYWNSMAIQGIGLEAVDPVLEFSLKHPAEFLDRTLGSFCKQSPETVAAKLVKVLQNPEHKLCHRDALHALAIAAEPKVESYKRVPVNLEGEHVVESALPFLDNDATRANAAQVIAGWSPKPPEALGKVVKIFVENETRRIGLLRVLASFPELPEEVAEPLCDLSTKKMAGIFLEPWHRALTRLSPAGKAKILDKMRAHAVTSPRAAIGVMALDPGTRREMMERLDEMKKSDSSIELLLRWSPKF